MTNSEPAPGEQIEPPVEPAKEIAPVARNSQTKYLVVSIAVLAALGLFLILKPTTEAFELRGELALSSDGAFSMNPRCGGKDGYDDINRGAAVVVYDAAGKVLATGNLGEGRFASQSLDSPCVFTFAVRDVPGGEKIYQVQVSHRGKVPVQSEAAKAGRTSLSLG